MDKFNKTGQIKMSLNELNIVENDPTILRGVCIVHDFEVSGNGQVITEEVASENIQTLIGKRICCKYIKREDNSGEDSLGSHEEYETVDRNGEEAIQSNTEAIGFIEDVFIDDFTDSQGITKRVVYANVVLWNDDKYKDIIGLMSEWLEKGIKINMSVEYLYYNFTSKNGIEYINSPIIYIAHTLLNSEDRGDMLEVLPSYECARLLSFNELQVWNKAVSSLKCDNKLNKTSKEENNSMENKFLKALNELSIGDLRSSIMNALGDVMTGNEYENLWISNYGIFSESKYFIYETYEDSKWVSYKVAYSLGENDSIVLDFEGKEKVEGQYTYVSVNELEKSSNELVEKDNKINELNETIISLNEKVVEKSTNEKEKVGELETTLASLNSKIEEMKPIVDEYNKAQFEKAFNEASENFKAKFVSVNALDVFEDKATQELIKESVNSDETISNKAKFSLNSLIVENIKSVVEIVDTDDIMSKNEHISINSVQKLNDTENLINNDTDSIYAEEYGINYK